MIHNINKKLISIVFIAMLSAMVYISVTSNPITFATVTSGSKVVKLPIKYTAGNGNYTDTLPASGANYSWILSAGVNATFTYLNTSLVGPLTITSFTGVIYANDTAAVVSTNMTYGLWDSNTTLIRTGNVTSSISNVATAAITLTALTVTPAAVIPAGREFYFTLASNRSTTQISFNGTTYPSYFSLTCTDHLSISISTDKAAGSTYKAIGNTSIWEPIQRNITATNTFGNSDIANVTSYFKPYNKPSIRIDGITNTTTTGVVSGTPFLLNYTYTDITNKTYANQWWYPTAILTDQSGNTVTEPDSASDDPNHKIYMSWSADADTSPVGQLYYFIENNTAVFALFIIVVVCCIGGAVVALSSTRIAGKRR